MAVTNHVESPEAAYDRLRQKEELEHASILLRMIAEDARRGTIRDPKNRNAKGRSERVGGRRLVSALRALTRLERLAGLGDGPGSKQDGKLVRLEQLL